MEKWETTPEMVGLTRQTFQAAKQTTSSYILLADYLIDVKGLDYVLTGHILSDFLEGRFSWYRKIGGGNHHVQVYKIMQAEGKYAYDR